ncbi:MAG: hypothetical protein NVSMB52_03970 [Chloroflexota bacterium]
MQPARRQRSRYDPARIAHAADAVVEASCLGAAAILPLYFSLLTSTVWETDKAIMLITLAAIAALGLLVSVAVRGLPDSNAIKSNHLVWAGVAVFVAYAIGTMLSIEPRLSFYGSVSRHEGLLTHAAYLVFFLAAATRLHRRSQIQRLMTVLILASLLPVVYGLLQQAGYDPLPASGDPAVTLWPVRSSFGDHIFFGAYLVLLIPITAARVFALWQSRSTPPQRGSIDEAAVAVMAVAFSAITFMGLLVAAAHIPAMSALFPAVFAGYAMLAIIVERLPDSSIMRQVRLWGYGGLLALQILVLLFTSARGPWFGAFAIVPAFGLLLGWRLHRPRLWWSALGATVAGVLFVVILNIPNGPLQPLRTVRGFNHIANIIGSDSKDTSVQGRLQVWQGVTTLLTTQPSIGNTWGGPLRDITGYGPDSLHAAFEKVFPLKLRRDTVENYSLDRSHDIYLDTMVDAGLLALLTLLLAVGIFFRRTITLFRHATGPAAWLLMGLIGVVVGHLVEGVFGIETPVTLLLFWLILGIVAGWKDEEPELVEAERETRTRGIGTVAAFWAIGLVFVVLFLIVSPGIDHPGLLTTIWLLGTFAGVGVLTILILPRSIRIRERAHVKTPVAVGANRIAASRPLLAVIFVLGLATLAAMVSQWRFESAAVAALAGSTDFARGDFTSGLGDAQQAARYASYVPQYREDLASAYLSLARMRVNSAEPNYRPSGDDAFSIDPGRALTFNGSQLTALGISSLQSAQSLAPLDPLLHESLANAYLNHHQVQKAIAEFQAAEKLSPNNPRYLDGEAEAQLAARSGSRANALASRAVSLDTRYWYSHYILALVDHQIGDRAGARSEASLGLFWAPITFPAPATSQMDRLRKLQRTG